MDTVDEKQLRKAYMDAFSTSSGALVLKDLANRCYKHDTTFDPDVTGNPELAFVNEGRRQMLLHIENMMSPEGIQKLAEEPGKGSA